MLNRFRSFITEKGLFNAGDNILLAISGGIDSVVMCTLFHQAGFSFGVAHCNFRLRGSESDDDEAFVRKLAGNYGVPFYHHDFSTLHHAEKRGISVQMAARELRYAWFEDLRIKEKYDYIATAHHLDDQMETFFINLLRSAGIAGFHGILPRQGKIIRPLLFCYRSDIVSFARKHKLIFREDSSNAEIKYLRNKIRHQVLPLFHELNPAFPQILTETIRRMGETELIFRKTIEEAEKKIIRKEKKITYIQFKGLKKLKPLGVYSFALLSPYGFNETTIAGIMRSTDGSSGQVFYSPTHRLIKNREELIIEALIGEPGPKAGKTEFIIPENKKEIKAPLRLTFTKMTNTESFVADQAKEAACLDLDRIIFPLTLRRWKRGDFFYPLGMNKKKKLSDFFIDNKFSGPEKESTWLLCSGPDIVWITGHRIDHRYRITPQTKAILHVQWIRKNR